MASFSLGYRIIYLSTKNMCKSFGEVLAALSERTNTKYAPRDAIHGAKWSVLLQDFVYFIEA